MNIVCVYTFVLLNVCLFVFVFKFTPSEAKFKILVRKISQKVFELEYLYLVFCLGL